MKTILALLLFITVFLQGIIYTEAYNPIITERFSADPAAIVHDGRVYLYVGHDEATENDNFFVLKEWNIYASDDLFEWTYKNHLPRTAFEWGMHDTAWASQAIERDGQFYWYTTVRHRHPDSPGYAIGIAVSDEPDGDFVDILEEPLVDSSMTDSPDFMGNDPWDVIDPTVFIDDDGTAYLYFGNTHLYYAELADNMVELASEVHQVDIENMPGSFTEGPYLFKRENLYYLTFAYNYPEELAYAVSSTPTGPWYFQDQIMDRIPNSGTSHPAVLNFEDEWYFIYHNTALPGGGEFNRSVAIEAMHFHPDGTIEKVVPTASGLFDSITITPFDTDLGLRQVTMQPRLQTLDLNHHDFRWHQTSGLNGEETVSYQIDNNPGVYLVMTEEGHVGLQRHDQTDAFKDRASFIKTDHDSLADAVHLSPYLNPSLYLMHTDGRISFQSLADNTDETDYTFVIKREDPVRSEQTHALFLPDRSKEPSPDEETVDLDDQEIDQTIFSTQEKPQTDSMTITGTDIVLILAGLSFISFLLVITVIKRKKSKNI